MGEMRHRYKILVGNHEAGRYFGEYRLRGQGKVTVSLKEMEAGGGVKMRTTLKWLSLCPVADSCGHFNVPSDSINNSEFLDQPSDYQLHESESTPSSYLRFTCNTTALYIQAACLRNVLKCCFTLVCKIIFVATSGLCSFTLFPQ
jgi:hypothetical protein